MRFYLIVKADSCLCALNNHRYDLKHAFQNLPESAGHIHHVLLSHCPWKLEIKRDKESQKGKFLLHDAWILSRSLSLFRRQSDTLYQFQVSPEGECTLILFERQEYIHLKHRPPKLINQLVHANFKAKIHICTNAFLASFVLNLRQNICSCGASCNRMSLLQHLPSKNEYMVQEDTPNCSCVNYIQGKSLFLDCLALKMEALRS
jgi:hypothetical protein